MGEFLPELGFPKKRCNQSKLEGDDFGDFDFHGEIESDEEAYQQWRRVEDEKGGEEISWGDEEARRR
ncbi:monothiol glutaredoxin-S17-like [Sesbania bispinosa]|nr:monothiol glutaredoxin-S17-like [Sesbania bispinosa]